jgi:hypothetical protein
MIVKQTPTFECEPDEEEWAWLERHTSSPPIDGQAFTPLDPECHTRLCSELESLKCKILDSRGDADILAASVAAVDVLKLVEKILEEACHANGLADATDGGLTKFKEKPDGRCHRQRLHSMGQYLRECIPLKNHLPKTLISRLHKPIAADRNKMAHEAGWLLRSSKGLEYCDIGSELLEKLKPIGWLVMDVPKVTRAMSAPASSPSSTQSTSPQNSPGCHRGTSL